MTWQREAGMDEKRRVSLRCSVYGGSDGGVAFLDMPEGIVPPPYIAHMAYLGGPYDVITRAVNQFPRQQELADLLGTRQQYISRWQNAECPPVLTDGQWAALVRIVLAVPV